MLDSSKKYLFPLLVTLLAFLSYNNNFFRVANEQLFAGHQVDSEQLVLDGILHRSDSAVHTTLGQYSRPGIENNKTIAHRLYAENNKEGEFIEYKSQFGLQSHAFNFLARFIYRDVRFLQSLSALLMSLVVALFFVAINREFSLKHAIFFCAPLIFSPWVAIFARNLYWVEATWFLPVIVTLFLGKQALASGGGALKMGVLLFAAFLLKFLCGYEYVTTIAIAATVPLVYFTIQYQYSVQRGLMLIMVSGISLVLAFSLAIGFHARSMSPDLASGLDHIMFTAQKRLSTANPDEIAMEACKDADDPDGCKAAYTKSLTSNRLAVAASYLLVPHFIPWFDPADFSAADRSTLKAVKDKPSVQSIRAALAGLDLQTALYLAASIASPLAFLLFTAFVLWQQLMRKDALSASLLVSFVASFSWFILAKAHSYVHHHMNYVLWYLLFVPFGMLLIADKLGFKRTENREK